MPSFMEFFTGPGGGQGNIGNTFVSPAATIGAQLLAAGGRGANFGEGLGQALLAAAQQVPRNLAMEAQRDQLAAVRDARQQRKREQEARRQAAFALQSNPDLSIGSLLQLTEGNIPGLLESQLENRQQRGLLQFQQGLEEQQAEQQRQMVQQAAEQAGLGKLSQLAAVSPSLASAEASRAQQAEQFGQRQALSQQQLGLERQRVGLQRQQIEAQATAQQAKSAAAQRQQETIADLLDDQGHDRRIAAIPGVAEKLLAPQEPAKLSDKSGIRKEFTKLSEPFVAVRDSYKRVLSAAENPSPAGDIALIFNYMKMLDPQSVVREGEFATAANAGGVSEYIRNSYNRLVSGERLTAGQRQDFLGQARGLATEQLESQRALEDEFRRISSRQGIAPEDVIVDFTKGFELGRPGGDVSVSFGFDQQEEQPSQVNRLIGLPDDQLDQAIDAMSQEEAQALLNQLRGQ